MLVRYEIEKMLIEEDLEVEKLPQIWNDKYEEYLGVRPSTDREGVLQDIHWSQGSIGYFPSYALGNAFGAQIYHQMKKELPVEKLLEAGNLGEIREYLRKNIHQYGKLKDSRHLSGTLYRAAGWRTLRPALGKYSFFRSLSPCPTHGTAPDAP